MLDKETSKPFPLPSEIWGIIIHQFMSSKSFGRDSGTVRFPGSIFELLKLSSVCWSWRKQIFNTSAYWKVLYINSSANDEKMKLDKMIGFEPVFKTLLSTSLSFHAENTLTELFLCVNPMITADTVVFLLHQCVVLEELRISDCPNVDFPKLVDLLEDEEFEDVLSLSTFSFDDCGQNFFKSKKEMKSFWNYYSPPNPVLLDYLKRLEDMLHVNCIHMVICFPCVCWRCSDKVSYLPICSGLQCCICEDWIDAVCETCKNECYADCVNMSHHLEISDFPLAHIECIKKECERSGRGYPGYWICKGCVTDPPSPDFWD